MASSSSVISGFSSTIWTPSPDIISLKAEPAPPGAGFVPVSFLKFLYPNFNMSFLTWLSPSLGSPATILFSLGFSPLLTTLPLSSVDLSIGLADIFIGSALTFSSSSSPSTATNLPSTFLCDIPFSLSFPYPFPFHFKPILSAFSFSLSSKGFSSASKTNITLSTISVLIPFDKQISFSKVKW